MTKLFYLCFFILVLHQGTSQDLIEPTDLKGVKAVVIANINGDVTMTSHSSSILKVEGTIDTDSKTKEKVSVKKLLLNDTLIVYIESPLAGLRIEKNEGIVGNSWGVYDWENQKNCSEMIEFTIDMKVSLPPHIPSSISTINEGDISVEDHQSALWVNNINGAISLNNVTDVRVARTINGDLDIYFNNAIAEDGEFYTLNGSIQAYYKPNTDVNFSFKSFNGDFYTDVELQSLPTVTTSSNEKNGLKLKISEKIKMKMGNGGSWHHFETFNGDAIVRTYN